MPALKANATPFNLRTCDKVKAAGTQQKPFFGWYNNNAKDNEIQTKPEFGTWSVNADGVLNTNNTKQQKSPSPRPGLFLYFTNPAANSILIFLIVKAKF